MVRTEVKHLRYRSLKLPEGEEDSQKGEEFLEEEAFWADTKRGAPKIKKDEISKKSHMCVRLESGQKKSNS